MSADLSQYKVQVTKALRYRLPNMDSVLLTTPEPTLGPVLGHAMTIVDGTVAYFASKCDWKAAVNRVFPSFCDTYESCQSSVQVFDLLQTTGRSRLLKLQPLPALYTKSLRL